MSEMLGMVRRYAPAGIGSLVLAGLLGGCVSPGPRDNYVVFFDRDSVSLNSTAEAVVAQAAHDAQSRHSTHILVSGSAGRGEDPDILHQLAGSRAAAVVETLEKDGIDAKVIRQSPYQLNQFEDSRVALRRVTIRLNTP